MQEKTFQTMVLGFCAFVLFTLALQAVWSPILPARMVPKPTTNCVGEPIFVPYPYEGAPVDPHSCKIQCEDGKQRHLVYTNDIGTPCQTVPGCLDEGEDNGVTCRPPQKAPMTTR